MCSDDGRVSDRYTCDGGFLHDKGDYEMVGYILLGVAFVLLMRLVILSNS